MSERCTEGVLKVPGMYMEGVWKVFGRSLEGFSKASERCWEGVFKISGWCLEHVLNSPVELTRREFPMRREIENFKTREVPYA